MTSSLNRRVAVTGVGVASNLGLDTKTFWAGLTDGRSGLSRIESFDQSDEVWAVNIAGEIKDFDPTDRIDAREAKRMDRFCQLGVYAAAEAADDAGLDFGSGDPYRRGVVIGSGVGGIQTIEQGLRTLVDRGPRKLSPFTVPMLMVNACAGHVSIRYDLRGANSATATACATAAHAIGTAFHLIQRGDADVILAGGSEAAVSPLCIGSFAAMKALSKRNDDPQGASRPFDRDRDGFVLAEGAAILVLEALDQAVARGANIYGEVVGFGSSGDANHIAAPDPGGQGALKSMEAALRDAQINPDQINYVNAHGTSTPLGDSAEVAAVKSLFGDHATKLCMSSTKSMTGHTLGAAGSLESAAAVLAVRDGVAPPTMNLDHPDDGFDLDFVANAAQERPMTYALNNSFGFGGHNVSLVFRKFDGS